MNMTKRKSTMLPQRTHVLLIRRCISRLMGVSGAAALLMAVLFTGCNNPISAVPGGETAEKVTPAKTAADEPIQVALVLQEQLVETVEVPMSIDGYEMALLKSRLDGYVSAVHVNIGDMVQLNQPLVTLSVPELVAEQERRAKLVAKAEADFKTAQSARATTEAKLVQAQSQTAEQEALLQLKELVLKQREELVRSGALRKEKVDEARYEVASVRAAMLRVEADVAAAQANILGADALIDSADADRGVAEAELRKATVMTDYLTIKAPFAGLITERMVDPGAFVRPATNGGSPLVAIERVDKVRAVLFVPMTKSRLLNVGDSTVLKSIKSLPGVELQHNISRLSQSFHRGSRMMRAEIDIENLASAVDGGGQLKPGDYGLAVITLRSRGLLPVVPTAAIGNDESGDFVVLLDETNTCHKRYVTVGTTEGQRTWLFDEGREFAVGKRLLAKNVGQYRELQTVANKLEVISFR
jgi:RND family efflux transporter MFP subunit